LIKKKNQTFSAYLPELGLTKAEYRAQTWRKYENLTKSKTSNPNLLELGLIRAK